MPLKRLALVLKVNSNVSPEAKPEVMLSVTKLLAFIRYDALITELMFPTPRLAMAMVTESATVLSQLLKGVTNSTILRSTKGRA